MKTIAPIKELKAYLKQIKNIPPDDDQGLGGFNSGEMLGKIMKFVKGMLIGSMVSVGIIMLCNENMNMSKKRMIKKGKQYARKIGII